MKLLVLSDIHSNYDTLERVMLQNPSVDAVFFLGDGEKEMERWRLEHPTAHKRIYSVRGNCDWDSQQPTEGLAPFCGILFFYTHGQNYGVKMGTALLEEAAQRAGAQVALFGHTHDPLDDVRGGVHLFNPGSLSFSLRTGRACYGLIEVTADGFVNCSHICL